jgi:restriction system protein
MHSSSQFIGLRGASRAHAALVSMSWRDVERVIGAEFRRRGFMVTGFGGAFAAGSAGVDIALMKDGERFLVECKQWRKRQVGLMVVRDLGFVIRAAGARGGYLFTAGEFAREARELALCSRIELIDGQSIIDWLRWVNPPETIQRPEASQAPEASPGPEGSRAHGALARIA